MTTTRTKRTTAKKTAKTAKKAAKPKPSAPARVGPVNEWFELRRSAIQGFGAFALQDIPKGTRIIEYVGERITNAEADRREEDNSRNRHHTFVFILNAKTCLDGAFGGNESIYINHSCEPNCEVEIVRGRIWIEAGRDIAAGEELTYDYDYDDDKDYTEVDLLSYPCQCGSAKCRGTIVNTQRLRQ